VAGRRDYRLTRSPEGEQFGQLLRSLFAESEEISLVWPKRTARADTLASALREGFAPFVTEERVVRPWPGTGGSAPEVTLTFYRPERVIRLALTEAGSLGRLVAPDWPENLACYRAGRECWFGSTTDGDFAFVTLPDSASADRMPGLPWGWLSPLRRR